MIHELSGPVIEKKPAKADQAAGLTLTNGPKPLQNPDFFFFFYKYPRKESGIYRDTHTHGAFRLFMLICHYFLIFGDKLSEV